MSIEWKGNSNIFFDSLTNIKVRFRKINLCHFYDFAEAQDERDSTQLKQYKTS